MGGDGTRGFGGENAGGDGERGIGVGFAFSFKTHVLHGQNTDILFTCSHS